MYFKKYIVVLFTLFNFQLLAQDTIGLPLIRNYNYQEYHAHYQTWNATQSKDGIMFFANGDGLLTFDGKNWDVYNLPNEQFPRTLCMSEDNKLYLGGDGCFGQMIVDSNGKLKYKSLNKLIPSEYRKSFSVLKIISADSKIFVLTSNLLFIISEKKQTKVIKSENRFFDICISGSNILLVQNRGFKLINSKNQSKNLDEEIGIFNFFERNDTTFFVDLNYNIYFLDKNFKSIYYSHLDFDFKEYSIDYIYSYQNKYLILKSINNGLLILNYKGKKINNLNKNHGIISNNIYDIFTDKTQNIWLSTADGISYVEQNSPIRIINNKFGIDFSTINSFNYFNNKIYFNSGIEYYSIDFRKNGLDIQNIEQAIGQTWSGIEIGNEIYLSHNQRILRIDKEGKIKIYGSKTNVWKIIQIPGNNKYLVGTSTGLLLYEYNGDSLKYIKKLNQIDDPCREFIFDSFGNLWLDADYKGIYKIKLNKDFEIEKKEIYSKPNGLPLTNSMILFNWKDHLLISVYKTLYEYDYINDSIHVFHPIVDKYDYSGEKVLQLVSIDKNDVFWFEYYNNKFNYEVFALKNINGEFKEIYPFSRRLMNFSLSSSYVYDKNYNVITTNNGLVLLNTKQEVDTENEKYQTIINKVLIIPNDSIVFYGYSFTSNPEKINTNQSKDNELTLKFKYNNIRFQYSATYYTNSENTLFRYKLINYDKEWSSWTFDTKKDYTNLPPGKYIFTVEAKNIVNKISYPAYFNIYIKSPWYRSVYAYIFYFIFIIFLLIMIVKYFTYSLKKKNEKLEKIVEERTSELVQKNTELEQQTEEIITQTEELHIVNQELKKLSAAVRETDNAIILADKDGNFIWVNSAFTKIFGYTFEELVNNISHNLISERTENHIKNEINKCLNEKIAVEYELKLKNKFNKEIWVHTTLTPILDENDNIETLIAIDSDITKLKNAEAQIREQRDQIQASITYAKTIQDSVLPKQEFISNLFDNFIIFKAKDIVSGDFYWISNVFVRKPDGNFTRIFDQNISFEIGMTVFFAVVDCTGHGVPGAFMSLIGSHLLGEIINEEKVEDPKQILEKLDSKLSTVLNRSKTKNYDGMVVSICKFEKLNIDNQEKVRVTFSGSKQHITYYKKEISDLVKIRGTARQIGFVINEKIEYKNHVFFLNIGDFIFLYSDGLQDLNNQKRESFGYSRIFKIIKFNIENENKVIQEKLSLSMNEWLKDELQRDDITFIALKMI